MRKEKYTHTFLIILTLLSPPPRTSESPPQRPQGLYLLHRDPKAVCFLLAKPGSFLYSSRCVTTGISPHPLEPLPPSLENRRKRKIITCTSSLGNKRTLKCACAREASSSYYRFSPFANDTVPGGHRSAEPPAGGGPGDRQGQGRWAGREDLAPEWKGGLVRVWRDAIPRQGKGRTGWQGERAPHPG